MKIVENETPTEETRQRCQHRVTAYYRFMSGTVNAAYDHCPNFAMPGVDYCMPHLLFNVARPPYPFIFLVDEFIEDSLAAAATGFMLQPPDAQGRVGRPIWWAMRFDAYLPFLAKNLFALWDKEYGKTEN